MPPQTGAGFCGLDRSGARSPSSLCPNAMPASRSLQLRTAPPSSPIGPRRGAVSSASRKSAAAVTTAPPRQGFRQKPISLAGSRVVQPIAFCAGHHPDLVENAIQGIERHRPAVPLIADAFLDKSDGGDPHQGTAESPGSIRKRDARSKSLRCHIRRHVGACTARLQPPCRQPCGGSAPRWCGHHRPSGKSWPPDRGITLKDRTKLA